MCRWHELVILALLAGGCGGSSVNPSGAPAPERSEPGSDAAATLTVENQGFADVTVYAVSPTGNRVRLGQVSGNSTQLLSLPDYLVRGGEQLRFFADPIGGAQTPVSEELYVAPGESVTLTIPPR